MASLLLVLGTDKPNDKLEKEISGTPPKVREPHIKWLIPLISSFLTIDFKMIQKVTTKLPERRYYLLKI